MEAPRRTASEELIETRALVSGDVLPRGDVGNAAGTDP